MVNHTFSTVGILTSMDAPKSSDPSADGAERDAREAIALLRDQVDLLQIQSSEAGRPWFKEPSVVVSALALLVSVGLGLFTIYDQTKARSAEFIQEKSKQLAEVADKLIENRVRLAEVRKLADLNDRVLQDQTLNASRYITLERGQQIIKDLGSDASVNALLILGYEHQLDSSFDIARDYYVEAVGRFDAMQDAEKEHRVMEHVVALRSLAGIYALPDTGFYDMDKSRQYWQQTNVLMDDRRDPYSRATLGTTLRYWAFAEFNAGRQERALELLAQAQAAFESMDLHPMRQEQLALVDQDRAFFDNPQMFSGQDQGNSILGEWNLEFPSRIDLAGRAVGLPGVGGAAPTLLFDVFDARSGILVSKSQGWAVLVDPDTVRIDWQGMRGGGQAGSPVMLSGVTTLTRGNDGSLFQGDEQALGQPPLEIILSRPQP